ncbi:MAG: glycoside hydrolase family 31 protein [Candidatus Pristimantibacillus lignocellulolyticus]|uniref:Glycoside hydrolase family 31 protein n=1 Tax=Candidatus Pristimantibacillus lignocellulolyticus TaxID=2994561 RepID=A0A9J6ZH63_9BACL|nr:MAG: glycoside hydrolase family 31 protein [Candidatus Pristimantibacillus lignocellulolyticus]
MIIQMLDEEYWYGGCVSQGNRMPVGVEDKIQFVFDQNPTPNQTMPLFISSKGRYLWRETGFTIDFNEGIISCPDDLLLASGYESLRGAYQAAMKAHFPFKDIKLSEKLFVEPIFNSWIELTFNQNEKDLLQYAKNIVANGFKPGVLMIDDGWSEYYGNWSFHSGKFPNEKAFIQELKGMGFEVMLWVCPFITPDTVAYRETKKLDLLVKTPNGTPYICEWWNGHSAVLDFSNPEAVEWFDRQMQQLQNLGIDGFKFDAGDSCYYREDNVTHGNVTPDIHSSLWASYGTKYELNEYRVTFKSGGFSLFQRLCDKEHSWGEKGIKALIPDSLLQGITGHPFSCPDMVGGGEYLNFAELEENGLDQELFSRHSEIACLMPSIQFSAAPWRVLSAQYLEKIHDQLRLRTHYLPQLKLALNEAVKQGEPVIRYMEYQFPGEGLETVTDQFMLGNTLLVAPLYEKGSINRVVAVPKGIWKFGQEIIVSKGELHTFTPPADIPIVLQWQDDIR